tara:strand:- start:261 stop:431 length:171 start_codon:yes stop_codon:yes gene_type:complete
MLFRCINGELIEIKRFDYTNDKHYFRVIMKFKKNKSNDDDFLKKNEEVINKIYKLI